MIAWELKVSLLVRLHEFVEAGHAVFGPDTLIFQADALHRSC